MKTNPYFLFVLGTVAFLVVRAYVLSFRTIFAVTEGHAALLYRFGKFIEQAGPGRHVRWGRGWVMSHMDLRERQIVISGQELLSADNVGIKVSAVMTFVIIDAPKVAHAVQDFPAFLHNAVQLALRAEIGGVTVEDLLSKRLELGANLLIRVKPVAEAIGVQVNAVEVRDVMFPGELKKVFTEVLRAQKEGQAALERARGESASLRNLANAARLLENNPALMNLRLLQTIGGGPNNTYVMGVPAGLTPIVKTQSAVVTPQDSPES